MPILHIQKGDIESTYFVTLTVVEWLDIFTSHKFMQILLESLQYCQKEKGLLVVAYVFMTNHIHLIISSKSDSLDNILRDFKRHTTKQIKSMLKNDRRKYVFDVISRSDGSIWQSDNFPELITTRKFLEQKTNYIHNNPVKKGLVAKPEDWLFSSASNYYLEKGLLAVTKY